MSLLIKGGTIVTATDLYAGDVYVEGEKGQFGRPCGLAEWPVTIIATFATRFRQPSSMIVHDPAQGGPWPAPTGSEGREALYIVRGGLGRAGAV